MGFYLNPGNESFRSALASEIYVDKTGLLGLLNNAIGTAHRYFAVSRARRFGKSMAAGMMDAYYSIGCHSGELFDGLEIGQEESYRKHLNAYNVLHIDAASFFGRAKKASDFITFMDETLIEDFRKAYPEFLCGNLADTPAAIHALYEHTGRKFVIIIDEWDCVIRDAKDDAALISDYLRYLRGFFKTEESKQFLALGYLTGILPIKKIEGESAMNNFDEYSMTRPGELTKYFGFTEQEVEALCEERSADIRDVREWYDGYLMAVPDGRRMDSYTQLHIYNPNSLVMAFHRRGYESFWKNTGAFRGLNAYIERNEAGLKDDVLTMLSGGRVELDTTTYQNDLTSFRSKDDVLAALIHMGYLGYDSYRKEAFIPNREVAEVFESAIKVGGWEEIGDALRRSEQLLQATWEQDAARVASEIERSQQDYAAIIRFHDENALACAIMMSYYTARTRYHVIREFPSGRGFADLAFLPKYKQSVPAMVVELKWNRSARAALKQIREKNYAGALSAWAGEVLLVGINYSQKTGRYSCKIESARFPARERKM